MKYKIKDNDLNKYMAGEEIFNSKIKAIDYLKSYFSADHTEEELQNVDEEYCTTLANFEFEEVCE